MNPRENPSRRQRLYEWWFLCIGIGFTLLGIRSLLAGQRPLLAVLRFIIAAGFLILGHGALKRAFRKPEDG